MNRNQDGNRNGTYSDLVTSEVELIQSEVLDETFAQSLSHVIIYLTVFHGQKVQGGILKEEDLEKGWVVIWDTISCEDIIVKAQPGYVLV